MMTCASSVLGTKETVPFIFCALKFINGQEVDAVVKSCVPAPVMQTNMKNCMDGMQGQNLQANVATATVSHTYVPWVTVNGVHNKTAEDDFKKFVCQMTPRPNWPLACSAYAFVMRKEHSTRTGHHLGGCPNPFYEGGAPASLIEDADSDEAAAIGPHSFREDESEVSNKDESETSIAGPS